MTWYANQIYAKPTADVIAAFRTQPFLADQLYHVDDLRGVGAESTRELLLSRKPLPDREHIRHGLPPGQTSSRGAAASRTKPLGSSTTLSESTSSEIKRPSSSTHSAATA